MLPITHGPSRAPHRRASFLQIAALPLAVGVAIAGCGSSTQASSAGATHAHTSHTKMKHHDAMKHHDSMMAGATHAMPAFAHAAVTLHPSEYGPVIFDQNHTALYVFSADSRSKSNCYGACQAAWPPFLTKKAPSAGAGLSAGLLGTTRRRDGSLQVTYAGRPLYFYSGDKGSQIGCQHVKLHGGFWYVLRANGTPNLAKAKAMV